FGTTLLTHVLLLRYIAILPVNVLTVPQIRENRVHGIASAKLSNAKVRNGSVVQASASKPIVDCATWRLRFGLFGPPVLLLWLYQVLVTNTIMRLDLCQRLRDRQDASACPKVDQIATFASVEVLP